MTEENKYIYKRLPDPIPIIEQNWPNGILPLVHTRTMTFNHQNYIRDCIEGILMQKTTFPVQVLIHDDASTDNTKEIVKEYEQKYPRLIKAYYQKENSFTKPDKHKRREEFMSWRIGKYEAICEGDDYWIDSDKLQIQVEFLEFNPKFSFCFHRINTIDEHGSILKKGNIEKNILKYTTQQIFDLVIPTPSILMRNFNWIMPPEFSSLPHGDAFLITRLAQHGHCADLGFVGANYRIHSGGMYSVKLLSTRYINTIKTRRIMLESDYFPKDFNELIKRQMKMKKKKYLLKLLKKVDIIGFLKLLLS